MCPNGTMELGLGELGLGELGLDELEGLGKLSDGLRRKGPRSGGVSGSGSVSNHGLFSNRLGGGVGGAFSLSLGGCGAGSWSPGNGC